MSDEKPMADDRQPTPGGLTVLGGTAEMVCEGEVCLLPAESEPALITLSTPTTEEQ